MKSQLLLDFFVGMRHRITGGNLGRLAQSMRIANSGESQNFDTSVLISRTLGCRPSEVQAGIHDGAQAELSRPCRDPTMARGRRPLTLGRSLPSACVR